MGNILNRKNLPTPPSISKTSSMNAPKIPIGHVLQVLLVKMSVKWKERGHEVEDHQALHDQDCVNALRNCGLLKLFQTACLRSQLKLLQYLINIWDVDRKLFVIEDQELELDVMDIYFIIGLSRRGERIQLSGARAGGESTNMLIQRYCPGARKTKSGKVDISSNRVPPLRTILHCITRVTGA